MKTLCLTALAALSLSATPLPAAAYEASDVEVAFMATITLSDQETGFAMRSASIFYLFDDGVYCECSDYPIGTADYDWLKLTDPDLFGKWERAIDGFRLSDSNGNMQVVSRQSVQMIKGG